MQEHLTAFDEYITYQLSVSPNTRAAYVSDLKQLMSFLERKKVTELSTVTIHHLREYLKVLKDRGLKPRTMARKVAAIKLFWHTCAQRQGVANVAQALIFPKLDKRLPTFCHHEEIDKLLTHAGNDSPRGQRNRCLVYLLYITGMRVSEAVSLRVRDMHLPMMRVTVTGKGSKMRIIPLPPESKEVITNYLENIRPQLIPLKKRYLLVNQDYVFPVMSAGKLAHLSRQAAWRILRNACHKAGLAKTVSPHTLRHSLATHLLKEGIDMRTIQLLLGHEHITTVEIYTHVETSYLRNMYALKHPRS